MKRRKMKVGILFLMVSLISGCALQSTPDPELQAAVKQHTAILAAISSYINDLQEKGVLPKPESKEEKSE